MSSNVQLNRMYKLFFGISRTISSLIQLTKLTDILETGSSEVENFRVGLGREREREREREKERKREIVIQGFEYRDEFIFLTPLHFLQYL